MKKLAGWAAVISVPTLVTGWFGINVPYLGAGQPSGLISAAVYPPRKRIGKSERGGFHRRRKSGERSEDREKMRHCRPAARASDARFRASVKGII